MEFRLRFVCLCRRLRVGLCLLVCSFTCLAGGCGAKSGSDAAAQSRELPPSAKSLKEHMKERTAQQKAAMGKRRPTSPRER
jgi:hypothetical protein